MVLYEIYSVKSRVTNTYVHWLYDDIILYVWYCFCWSKGIHVKLEL